MVDRVFENGGVCGFEVERTNEVAVKAVDRDEIVGMEVVRCELADGLAELRDKFVLLAGCIDQDGEGDWVIALLPDVFGDEKRPRTKPDKKS